MRLLTFILCLASVMASASGCAIQTAGTWDVGAGIVEDGQALKYTVNVDVDGKTSGHVPSAEWYGQKIKDGVNYIKDFNAPVK